MVLIAGTGCLILVLSFLTLKIERPCILQHTRRHSVAATRGRDVSEARERFHTDIAMKETEN